MCKTKNLWAEYLCMDINGWVEILSLFAFKIIYDNILKAYIRININNIKKNTAYFALGKLVFPLKICDIIDLCFRKFFREIVRELETILSIVIGILILCEGNISFTIF